MQIVAERVNYVFPPQCVICQADRGNDQKYIEDEADAERWKTSDCFSSLLEQLTPTKTPTKRLTDQTLFLGPEKKKDGVGGDVRTLPAKDGSLEGVQ